MREFVLVDLRSQLPYLPRFMQLWTRGQVLEWLRLYGQVYIPDSEHTLSDPDLLRDVYYFRSWCGLESPFVLAESLELYIPSSAIRAWNDGG